MARAALILFELTMDQRYFEKAKAWTERVETQFRDAVRGGYYLTSAETADVSVRIKTGADGATPNYNGVLIEVLARLAFLTGEEKYRERSNAAIASVAAEVDRNAIMMATVLNGLEFVVTAVQVVIIGDERAAETQALMRAVLERSLPCRLMTVIKPGQKLPKTHPAFGKTMEGGMPTAYVCSAETCSAPVTDPQALFNGLMAEPFHRIAQMQAQMQAAQQGGQRPVAANNR
jgi:uncharacterized protein YyaL (SSP411 family)